MVKSLVEICQTGLTPRALGLDDAPFQSRPRQTGGQVHAVGIVTSGDRFEGMLYIRGLSQDGLNAQEIYADQISKSKFHPQIHAVLLDGISVAGLDIIDIAWLANSIQRIVIAVIRAPPNLPAFEAALRRLPNAEVRIARAREAAPVHQIGNWHFQYRCPSNAPERFQNTSPEHVAQFLDLCTPQGTQKIPECLRIAHLVGAAVMTGQSSSSA